MKGQTITISMKRAPDTLGHSGVQQHSAGPLFPAVIGRMERYPDGATAETAEPVTSWVLMLDGHEEEYATHDDAEQVARALLGDSTLRAKWRRAAA